MKIKGALVSPRSFRTSDRTRLGVAAAALTLILAYSGLRAYDRTMWLAEVSPVLVGLPFLVLKVRRFRFTSLVYGLIFVASLVYIVGGTYGYTRVPLGLWIQQALHGTRNPYDKIAHFAEGFVPALVIREFLVRENLVRGRTALGFYVLSSALAIGATTEILEWAAAARFGSLSDDFLGAQGDPFDTQSDLLFDLLGAVAAVSMSRIHDRHIQALEEARPDEIRPRER